MQAEGPALDLVRETARTASEAIAKVEAPLLALARTLEDILDEEAATLAASERARARGWPVLIMEGDHVVNWRQPEATAELLNGLR